MGGQTYVPLHVLAGRLGLPLAWLRREVADGRLPYVQAGAYQRFDVEQVREHLRERAEQRVREPEGAAT